MSQALPFRTFCSVGVICLAAGPASAQTVTSSSQFRQYKALSPTIERAFRDLKARRFDDAKATLKPCLEAVPDHFEAHYILALADFEARDFQGVLAHLEVSERSLVALEKGYRENLAEMKAKAEANEREARDNLNAAASRTADPTGFAAAQLSGLKMEVRMAEAKKEPSQKLENPFGIPADYLFLKGNALLRLGRREEARSAYRKTVEIDATHGNAWNNLIALGLGAKDLAAAREDLAKAEKAGAAIRPELKKAVLEMR